MPGLVSVFVWVKTAWGSMQLLHKQNLAVYDAQPGAVWDGFGGLIARISKDYTADGIWTAKPDRNAYPPEPPDVKEDPSNGPANLIKQTPDKIVFPERGTLLLVVLAGGSAPCDSESPLIGDATEWCTLYDVRNP